MESIEVPNWVRQHLADDETVISKYTLGLFSLSFGQAARVSFYATDRRVLRFHGKTGYDSLPYDGLSVTFRGRLIPFVAGGSVLFICGLLLIAFAIFTFIGPEIRTVTTITTTKAPLLCSCGSCLFGLLPIAVAATLPFGYYQFASPTLDDESLKKWRLPRDLPTTWWVGRFVRSVEQRASSLRQDVPES